MMQNSCRSRSVAVVGPNSDCRFNGRRCNDSAVKEIDGLPMQGLIAEPSDTPGIISWIGRHMCHDTETIRQRLWGDT